MSWNEGTNLASRVMSWNEGTNPVLAYITGYKDGPASRVSARVVGIQDVKMKRPSFHGLTTAKKEN